MPHTLSKKDVQLLIKFRAETGMSCAGIGKRIKVAQSTVRRWLKREVKHCSMVKWRKFLFLAKEQGLISEDDIPPESAFGEKDEYAKIIANLVKMSKASRMEVLNFTTEKLLEELEAKSNK